MNEIIANIFYWISLGLFGWWLWRKLSLQTWIKKGVFTVDKEEVRFYNYEYVDNKSYHKGALFSGIEIMLPKSLPHIFLDAQSHAKDHQTQILLDKNEKLSLEGDFDKFFQMYAPTEYQSLALSIISPDVMSQLINASQKYNVEIDGHYLRIFSASNLKKHPETQAEILKIATMIAKELDHRIKSWNEEQLKNNRLNVIEADVIRVGRSYLPKAMFGITAFLLIVSIPFWANGIYVYIFESQIRGIVSITAGFIFYPVSYFVIRLIVRSY